MSPRLAVTVGRLAAVGMSCLAVAWWGTLARDAIQGRSTWPLTVCAAAMVLAWAVVAWRWASALKPQPGWCLYWQSPGGMPQARDSQAIPIRWLDADGLPVDVRVVMDVGAGLLLRCQSLDARAHPVGPAQWRWVAAQALHGPWRWRLMSRGGCSAPRPDEASGPPTAAPRTLTAPRKAALPQSARRPA